MSFDVLAKRSVGDHCAHEGECLRVTGVDERVGEVGHRHGHRRHPPTERSQIEAASQIVQRVIGVDDGIEVQASPVGSLDVAPMSLDHVADDRIVVADLDVGERDARVGQSDIEEIERRPIDDLGSDDNPLEPGRQPIPVGAPLRRFGRHAEPQSTQILDQQTGTHAGSDGTEVVDREPLGPAGTIDGCANGPSAAGGETEADRIDLVAELPMSPFDRDGSGGHDADVTLSGEELEVESRAFGCRWQTADEALDDGAGSVGQNRHGSRFDVSRLRGPWPLRTTSCLKGCDTHERACRTRERGRRVSEAESTGYYHPGVASDLPALYRLGIIGSGQIARMTHQAAVKLGITPRLFAEDSDDSAAMAAPDAVYRHPDAINAFAESCEVLTVEHERIDIGLLERLEESGATIRPGTKALRAAFDKLHQRRLLLNREFPVPVFAEIRGPDDLIDFTTVFDFPVVLKAVRAGRPNARGVWIVENDTEAMRVMSEQAGRTLMAETFQPIVKELVALVVRRPGGSSRCYPLAEMVQTDGVVREIRSPAPVGHRIAAEAKELATRIADEVDAVGLLAVELFLTTDGLVVNEIAARPHNAGHTTIEGSPTSQFENHVRGLLDLPLGPTWAQAPATVTVNVVGSNDGVDPSAHLAEALAVEGVHVHLYGKRPLPGHKLGHVTALGDDIEQARDMARRAEAALMNRRHL